MIVVFSVCRIILVCLYVLQTSNRTNTTHSIKDTFRYKHQLCTVDQAKESHLIAYTQ